MAEIRHVTDDFAVAPQVRPEDLAELGRQGFRLVINNRPDGESGDQPPSTAVAMAARAAGLDYLHLPVHGAPRPGEVEAFAMAVRGAEGPVIAFCRSGTRSIFTWAAGEMANGRSAQELLELGRAAGYDLSPIVTSG